MRKIGNSIDPGANEKEGGCESFSMLEILRRIVQEVNAAPDLSSALNVMVSRVRLSMGTEVCSIYLLDHSANCYYLMATEGLNKAAVGTASVWPFWINCAGR